MFSPADTIVAIATPAGRGGIGIVRISGPSAQDVARLVMERADPLRPRYATFVRLSEDQGIATFFPGPRSYTGEDVVEISGHGSQVVLRAIVERALTSGARLAEPGEFTLRAFLNGRIDLMQAEAVADLVNAVTPLQARTAFDQLEGTLTERIAGLDGELFDLIARLEASLDFPEEGYHFVGPGEVAEALRSIEGGIAALVRDARRGRLIREGARVAIVGKPNVGKSSLFNALLGAGRAIVAPVPGTTRDLVTDTADIDGMKIDLVDTAGLRVTDDVVEAEGVARAHRAWATADLAIVLLDSSVGLEAEDRDLLERTAGSTRIVVGNKADLPRAWAPGVEAAVAVHVSSLTLQGIEALRHEIRRTLEGPAHGGPRDHAMVTNVRHAALLDRAGAAVRRALEAIDGPEGPVPEEFVLTDLQDARHALEEVTGKRTSEDVLRHIFSRFCIGK